MRLLSLAIFMLASTTGCGNDRRDGGDGDADADVDADGDSDGDADAAGTFDVRVLVRGINIQAIDRIQVRFEALGDTVFEVSGAGPDPAVALRTEEDGRVYLAEVDRAWFEAHYVLTEAQFQLDVPLVNPQGQGPVQTRALVHRDVEGSLVLIGDSDSLELTLPAESGSTVEVITGCIADGDCSAR